MSASPSCVESANQFTPIVGTPALISATPPAQPAQQIVFTPDQLAELVSKAVDQKTTVLQQRLDQLSAVVNRKVVTKPAKVVAPPEYVILLQKGSTMVRVVEREARVGTDAGLPKTLNTKWPSKKDAEAFWHKMPWTLSYKERQTNEGWRVRFEPYTKAHDNLSTKFGSASTSSKAASTGRKLVKA